MALIDKPQFNMYSPLINMYANRQYVNNMSEEEKKKSNWDNDLFQGKLKDVTFSNAEAVGLGVGLLGSIGQYRLDKRDYNNQLDRINKYKSTDYMYAPKDYYSYNAFSNNSYNNSYYEEGGIEDNNQSLNSTDYYSPFEESNNDDELVMTFLNELYDEEDDNNYYTNDNHYNDNYGFNNKSSVQPSLHPSISSFLQETGLKPSSTTGGQHNKNSRHYTGNAIDLGLNTTFGGDTHQMEQFKNYFNTVVKNKYPNLRLIDERSHPKGQKVWSGSHYHIEVD